MTDTAAHPTATTPRQVADAYVHALADLDASVSSALGLRPHEDRVPDLSPAGQDAKDDLARATLARLDALPGGGVGDDADATERRCAVVLRERLTAQLEASAAGEHLRAMRNIFGPPQAVRGLFAMMPTSTDEDWGAVARRLTRVPDAYQGYVESLHEGTRRGLFAAPRQAETVVAQLDEWVATRWFHELVEPGPESRRTELDAAADRAVAGVQELRAFLVDTYLPAAQGTPDAVGSERYARGVRSATGSTMDDAALRETYAWGWSQVTALRAEMAEQADRVLPGASVPQAVEHLDREGEAVEGVEAVRVRLQQMMDTAITDLDGTHFDIADPVKVVEARIAPAGSAAAPYYTRPSVDFSRPGRTWLPTLGRTRFPLWDLVSTWYHEGVPGHHLQLAQWAHVAPQLSLYQTTLGSSSAATEGWALYAERLMDELGYLDDGSRLGYLDAQMLRAVRVVIDIGMHLELEVPSDSPMFAGERWTPQNARAFFAAHSGRDDAFVDSEVVRYLGWPGQAISYKLGERAWLAGRAAAQQARGADFDLKAWHMAALSMGALGLDDLTAELARL